MRRSLSCLFFVCAGLCCFYSNPIWAQEETAITQEQTDDTNDEVAETVKEGESYISSRISKTQKYLKRSAKVQHKLLKKLQRSEHDVATLLSKKYPQLYQQYLQNNISYDSMATLSQDSLALRNKGSPLSDNKLIDSLKNIQSFLQKQSTKLTSLSSLGNKVGINNDYTSQLNSLQQQLNAQQALQNLIQQQSQHLSSILSANNLRGFSSIQKDITAATSKIKYWKGLSQDPDAAEAKALEYLQGIKGFEKSFNTNNAYGGLGNNATAEDLERLGYQTKRQTAAALQQKFGDNLGKAQEQMGNQIKDYQEKLNGVKEKVSDAKQNIGEAKAGLNEAKSTAGKLKKLKMPVMKNPLRGIPFWKRWDVNYNFQTTRATADGLRPAMMDWGATAVFNHTPKISYGIGTALSIGLGQDWQHLRFSYEGISLRAYADCKMLHGFSLQAGYEKSLRPNGRNYINELQKSEESKMMETGLGVLQDAVYTGIMKRYRINKKWSGTMLICYNFLWQQSGMRSPWMIRLGWGNNYN